ncbi:MAG TPA: hypothetical protein VGX94_01380 [Terriglobia bacterium]|nr:hypothetical protein [Terriglobia bacterium]
MGLDVTRMQRNLRMRVRFFGLEAEDIFVLLAVAIAGQFLGRLVNRDLAGLPMSIVLEWGVPVIAIPALMLFKYGKQRHYFSDFIAYRSKPHVYSALETDSGLPRPYLREDEPCR